AVVSIAFTVWAREVHVSATKTVIPWCRRLRGVAFAARCGQQPIERIVGKEAIKRLDTQRRVGDAALRSAIMQSQKIAGEIVFVGKILQRRTEWPVGERRGSIAALAAQASQATRVGIIVVACHDAVAEGDQRALAGGVIRDAGNKDRAVER